MDTGAGVSLIKGDVWDQVIPSKYKRNHKQLIA